MELYKKYRPILFKQVLGQDKAIQVLESKIKSGNVPHSILISGPSGCGKTTIARILKTKLECGDEDFIEINCADFRGIEVVRDIRRQMNLSPMFGKCRIWLIDEGHRLTGEAQDALLKMMEDTPNHVYFMIATTNPDKIISTIRNRCTWLPLEPLHYNNLKAVIEDTLNKERVIITDEEVAAIIMISDGSARNAMVILDKIIEIEEKDTRLEIIRSSEVAKQSKSIVKALMNPKTKWAEITAILKNLEEEPETVRRQILGYASAVLLSGENKRAYLLICCFEGNFYDSGKSGLIRACYECFSKEK